MSLRGGTLDLCVLPHHLEAARSQFAHVAPMLRCFSEHSRDYPFPDDRYKFIEVPCSRMEHPSAVTQGPRPQGPLTLRPTTAWQSPLPGARRTGWNEPRGDRR